MGLSTYVPALSLLLLLFVSFISAQAQIIPSLYLPYPGSMYGNGGAIQITLPYSSSPVCQVRVPVTLPQYYDEYTTPEFFVVFLSTTSTVSSSIWASFTMSPPVYSYNGFGNTGAFSIGYGNYGAFIQIPPITVPSNYIDSSNHTTIYIGASNGYGTVVNASAALPQVLSSYSYNQTTVSVAPFTAEIVKFSSVYSSVQCGYFFETCSGNASTYSPYNSGVYMYWPPNSFYSTYNNPSASLTLQGPPIASGAVNFNNYVTTGQGYVANFSIPFNGYTGASGSTAWSWPPLIVSTNLVSSSSQGYAILTNNVMPSSGSYSPLVVYRPGFWTYSSYIPYASSEVTITTYSGGVILQIEFSESTCINYLSDDDVDLYFIDNSYANNLAVVSQGCFAQENAENDEIYNQISDYTVDTTAGVLTITVSVGLNSVSGNQVVVTVNSSECGYITFAPVSVPYGYTSSVSLSISNWKVMVPTILAVLFAIVAIILTIKVASLKSRLESSESSEHNSNEVSYEPILDGRGPLASSATAPLTQNYAPNYNYISYNPNPTNRGQQAPPLPPPHSASPAGSTLPLPPPHHAGLAGPQVVYSSTAPGTTAFPNSSLALYGIPPPPSR